jgi:hypothetical protein
VIECLPRKNEACVQFPVLKKKKVNRKTLIGYIPFYIKDLNICIFWYLQGSQNRFLQILRNTYIIIKMEGQLLYPTHASNPLVAK